MQSLDRTIDHISVNDIFWIQFKNHLISFGFKGLPANTHFTIAFDKRNPDINLHVTKNAADQKDKPQIKIAVIEKLILEQDILRLIWTMLNKMMEPFDIEKFKSTFDYELGFLSFENLKNSESYSLAEHKLNDSFKDVSRFRRRTRLKVEGDIEKRLEIFATSEEIQQWLMNNGSSK